ncbi:BatD family protein [uncultured Ilyobacter sp.]|uniref:BatD family protein n=1 Tax=uncultured Ilyobacter sp. TaxID=544433 RepID=UPI0029F4C5B3|nr:BatD family protein [uncultured Ilyobacter sp.]
MLCALLVGLPAVLAQPSVDITLNTRQPYVGEPLVLTLSVDFSKGVGEPQIPDIADCGVKVGRANTSTFYSSVNGQKASVRRSVAYPIYITPRKPGPLHIPSITIEADGQRFRTQEQDLIVRETPTSAVPDASNADSSDPTADLLMVEITSESQHLYVGQQAVFTLSIWVKPPRINGQLLDEHSMFSCIRASYGPFANSETHVRQVRRRAASGETELYYVYESSNSVTLDAPGPLIFDGVRVQIPKYPLRIERQFFDNVITKSLPVPPRLPVVDVPEVLPLPTENRPPSFEGAIGQYRLTAMAVPSNVRVGDPIQFVIDVYGDPLDTLPGPDLAANEALNADFRVPVEELAGTIHESLGERFKRFTQVIRATRADVTTIPPIEFCYFDPEVGEYVVEKTDPIPILVSASDSLDATDLDIAMDTPQDPASQVAVRDGLRGNVSDEVQLLQSIAPVTTTQIVAVTCAGPLAFAAFWCLLAISRRGNERSARRRRAALKTAEQRLRDVETSNRPSSDIEAALAGYLADRLDEPPQRFRGSAGVEYLTAQRVSPELVQRYAEVQRRSEEAAYAGTTAADATLTNLARQCLHDLEQEQL